ncbi:hypothetical protein EYF80_045216 [Liparis tanakae]|uniref:Uncharacterized protein n=1 Tax=Liparis tanakae TaxID=230148 RepID=A0A4Z2FV90_9TELE|nr:hypothetical protein EYF80_045216 [Liparis tanakae]
MKCGLSAASSMTSSPRDESRKFLLTLLERGGDGVEGTDWSLASQLQLPLVELLGAAATTKPHNEKRAEAADIDRPSASCGIFEGGSGGRLRSGLLGPAQRSAGGVQAACSGGVLPAGEVLSTRGDVDSERSAAEGT